MQMNYNSLRFRANESLTGSSWLLIKSRICSNRTESSQQQGCKDKNEKYCCEAVDKNCSYKACQACLLYRS